MTDDERKAPMTPRRFRMRLVLVGSRLVVTTGLLSLVIVGDLGQGASIAIVGAIAGYWLQSGEETALDAMEHVRSLREDRGEP